MGEDYHMIDNKHENKFTETSTNESSYLKVIKKMEMDRKDVREWLMKNEKVMLEEKIHEEILTKISIHKDPIDDNFLLKLLDEILEKQKWYIIDNEALEKLRKQNRENQEILKTLNKIRENKGGILENIEGNNWPNKQVLEILMQLVGNSPRFVTLQNIYEALQNIYVIGGYPWSEEQILEVLIQLAGKCKEFETPEDIYKDIKNTEEYPWSEEEFSKMLLRLVEENRLCDTLQNIYKDIKNTEKYGWSEEEFLEVLIQLAGKYKTPPEILQNIYKDIKNTEKYGWSEKEFLEMLTQLAGKYKTPPEILQNIYKDIKNTEKYGWSEKEFLEILIQLAGKYKTPPEILQNIYKDINDTEKYEWSDKQVSEIRKVLGRLARNYKTPTETLQNIYKDINDTEKYEWSDKQVLEILMPLAGNYNTPLVILQNIYKDINDTEKYEWSDKQVLEILIRLAGNYSTPLVILQNIYKDINDTMKYEWSDKQVLEILMRLAGNYKINNDIFQELMKKKNKNILNKLIKTKGHSEAMRAEARRAEASSVLKKVELHQIIKGIFDEFPNEIRNKIDKELKPLITNDSPFTKDHFKSFCLIILAVIRLIKPEIDYRNRGKEVGKYKSGKKFEGEVRESLYSFFKEKFPREVKREQKKFGGWIDFEVKGIPIELKVYKDEKNHDNAYKRNSIVSLLKREKEKGTIIRYSSDTNLGIMIGYDYRFKGEVESRYNPITELIDFELTKKGILLSFIGIPRNEEIPSGG